MFAASGALFSTWVARLPAVRDQVGAGPAELGTALLAAGAGSLVLMPLTGRLCGRFGSRAVVTVMALAASASVVLLSRATSLGQLVLVLLAWGAFFGSWDVAMNVQGSHVDQAAGRAWMPRYHASWSVGGVVGAALGALAARGELPVAVHLPVAAALAAGAVLVGAAAFAPDRRRRADRPDAGTGAGRPLERKRLLDRRLVVIGLVAVCATTAEGAAADWLALLLTDHLAAPPAAAAAGYAVFASAMASARFAGTWALARFGRVRCIRGGGVVMAAGVATAVLAPSTVAAWVGAAMWGLGVALVFPSAVSAGGETPGRGADAIAAVSTIGYAGFLVGPPLIGHLAARTGLADALWVVVLAGVGVGLLAGWLRPPPDRASGAVSSEPPPGTARTTGG